MGSILSLVLALAIIYFAYTRYAKVNHRGPTDVEQTMQAIDEEQRRNTPPKPQPQAQPTPYTAPGFSTPTPTPTGGLRAPIDRTRQVLDSVRQRANEAGQP